MGNRNQLMVSLVSMIVVSAALIPPTEQSAYASTINATATSLTGRQTAVGSNTWFFFTPKSTDTILWTTGENETDGGTHSKMSFVEPKFDTLSSPPAVLGTVFSFDRTDGPGIYGSTADTSGSGSSGSATTTVFPVGIPPYTQYAANWTVTATGQVGTKPSPPGAKVGWASQATGTDPFGLTLAEVSPLGPRYDLFFVTELSSASFSPEGGIGFGVSYETAAGVNHLFSLTADATGANVTSDDIATTFFLLNQSSGVVTGTETSLSALGALIDGQILPDRSLNSPVTIGFLLSGIPVPTVDLGDGTVARVSVETSAFDAAEIPEPSTFVLVAGSAIGSILCRLFASKAPIC